MIHAVTMTALEWRELVANLRDWVNEGNKERSTRITISALAGRIERTCDGATDTSPVEVLLTSTEWQHIGRAWDSAVDE